MIEWPQRDANQGILVSSVQGIALGVMLGPSFQSMALTLVFFPLGGGGVDCMFSFPLSSSL